MDSEDLAADELETDFRNHDDLGNVFPFYDYGRHRNKAIKNNYGNMCVLS